MGAAPPGRRRRREKKLMSMDEVNERFPLTKYKVWRASREQKGLPAAGGITAPASRAASISSPDAVADGQAAPPVSTTDEDKKQDAPPTELPETHAEEGVGSQDFAVRPRASIDKKTLSVDVSEANRDSVVSASTATPLTTIESQVDGTSKDHDDEDEPIQSALPDSMLDQATPGDSCAICIDSLDDEDEVRGLTCGHAFHASCLDPWLTSRRACCPLCKEDYYVPKVKPDTTENANAATVPSPPPAVHPRHFHFGGFGTAHHRHTDDPAALTAFGFATPSQRRARREARTRSRSQPIADTATGQQESAAQETPTTEQETQPGAMRRFGNLVTTPSSWLPRRQAQRSSETEAAVPTTPRQLEAGNQGA